MATRIRPTANGTRSQLAAERGVEERAPRAWRLDDIGRLHGTELSSLGRDCLTHWEPISTPLREERFDLLEIGVDAGASLRTWRQWFPHARLVGLDVRRIALDPPIEACVIVHGSQTDARVIRPLLRHYQFRMVVDDGSRHADDKIETFLMLFPWLAPGSVYFCTGFGDVDTLAEPPRQAKACSTGQGGTTPRWFAELGAALAGDLPPHPSAPFQDLRDEVLASVTGVVLQRGSVIVTN